ncbi:MAG: glycosyltransferase family 2 protein [Vicinamibacterales bacterium]
MSNRPADIPPSAAIRSTADTESAASVARNQTALVVAVILHFSRPADTLACVTSLRAGTYPRLHILVLDCGPTRDGALDTLRHESGVEVITVADNRGYAGNNNLGITCALARGADWVLLLNDDIIVDAEAVAHLVQVGESDPRVGVVGPMVYHFDEPTVIQSAGGGMTGGWDSFHFGQNEDDRGQFRGARQVAWISGCALMCRGTTVRDVGMLDERFFLYWEETEWCLRAGEAQWSIMHVPAARIWHKGVQRDYRPGPAVSYYSTRNHLLTLAVRHAPLAARLAVWTQVLRTVLSWTLRPKWRSKRAHRDAMWQGAKDYLAGRFGPWTPQ